MLSVSIGLRFLLLAALVSVQVVTQSPRRQNYRYLWAKDDDNSNKSVSVQRRAATTRTYLPELADDLLPSFSTPKVPGYAATKRLQTTVRPPKSRATQPYVVKGLRYTSPPPNLLSDGEDAQTASPTPTLAIKTAIESDVHRDQAPPTCSSPYRFGPNCDGICHCATHQACDKTTGSCRTGVCAHGFTDPPMCQRPCPSGQFGFRCGFYCHCWKGAACDSVNGFCAPDGKCAEEWFGPSCQIRKLELSDAPFVTVSKCENITVSWRQWTAELDFGNPEITVKNYELELRTPSRPQWRTIYRVLNDDQTLRSGSKTPVNFTYTPSPDTRFYQFRVIVNGVDTNGKYVTGVPSIPTEVFQRNCPTDIPDMFTLPLDTDTPPTPYTLPVTITPFTVKSSSPTTTATTTVTTTTPPIVVSKFLLANDPKAAGNVLASWKSSQGLPKDAGLLVEMLGIGDCDPFQTTDGPQIFRLSNTSIHTLRLEKWRQYRVTLLRSIAASDIAAASLASNTIVTTGNAPTAAPENLQLEDVTSRTARVKWSQLACQDRGDSNITYEVRLFRTPRTSGTAVTPSATVAATLVYQTKTNRTWLSFTQISPAYDYSMQVDATNNFGIGPSGYFNFTTTSEEQPRPAPQFLPVRGLLPDQMTLSWLVAPAAPGLVYPGVIECDLKVTPADVVVPIITEKYVNCSQTSRIITGLRPNTRYLVELTQTTYDGQRSSQTMVVATPEAPPGPPLSMTHRQFNKTCTEVDWDPPSPPNGLYLSVLDSYLPLRRSSVERLIQNEPGRLLCNLMLSTHYSFSAKAATSAGYGPMNNITFWTPMAEPDPPPVPFARLSEDDADSTAESAGVVVLVQPVRFSTGNIIAYYLKLATLQQMKEYETIYGVPTNSSAIYIPPDTKAESALAALPGRLSQRVLPDRFEQQHNGPLLYHTTLQVPVGDIYRVVWAVSVQLEDDTRLAASVSDLIRVPGTSKPIAPKTLPPETTATTTQRSSSPPINPPTNPPTVGTTWGGGNNEQSLAVNNSSSETKKDERVTWIFGIVIALIILLVILAIILIIICCCHKYYVRETVVTPPPQPIKKWLSSEQVQTEDFPLQLEDWFNPTTQIDDSRYVVRGQRVLTPTRYSMTITPRC